MQLSSQLYRVLEYTLNRRYKDFPYQREIKLISLANNYCFRNRIKFFIFYYLSIDSNDSFDFYFIKCHCTFTCELICQLQGTSDCSALPRLYKKNCNFFMESSSSASGPEKYKYGSACYPKKGP